MKHPHLATTIGVMVGMWTYSPAWLPRALAQRPVERARAKPASRSLVAIPEGIFLVYDAAMPQPPPRPDRGFLAYWRDLETDEFLVYGRLLHTQADVGQAIAALERDVGIPVEWLAVDSSPTEQEGGTAVAREKKQGADLATWEPASMQRLLELMGFIRFEVHEDLPQWQHYLDPTIEMPICDSTAPFSALGPMEPPPRPPARANPLFIINQVLYAAGCGGDPDDRDPDDDPDDDPPPGDDEPDDGDPDDGDPDDGDPPPDGCPCCADPCCGSSDPCCAELDPDPCCGSLDPCCGIDDGCCGSEEPCCDLNPDNPCCANPSPCCYVAVGMADCNDSNSCTDDGCEEGQCVYTPKPAGTACADDGELCTDDVCEDGLCLHPPIADGTECPDDGNPCTDDHCYGGKCIHPYRPECSRCGDTARCINGSCIGESCSLSLGAAPACPGETVMLALTGTCEPECQPTSWFAWTNSQEATTSSGGNLACPSDDVVVTVAVASEATPGQVTVTVEGTTSLGATCSATGTVFIQERIDLAFQGLIAENETDPGGFLALNDDDDDGDGTPDKDQAGYVANENDLVRLTVSPAVGWSADYIVTLSCESGCDAVRFYRNPNRTDPVTLPLAGGVSSAGSTTTLYVEGVSPSASVRDVVLAASFAGYDPAYLMDRHCEDIVKLTVFKLNSTIYNGGADLDHGGATGTLGPEVAEDDEDNVGACILVNWDDDDGDGAMNPDGSWSTEPMPDLFESSVQNEDNLAKLVLDIDPLPDAGILELDTTGYGSQVRVWSASTKESEINLSGYPWTWDLSNPTRRSQFQQIANDGLWIEGYAPSVQERDVAFVLRYKNKNGQELSSDTVRATVVMINLGNAVYRDNQIWSQGNRGHAALVWKFTGPLTRENLVDDAKFLIIEIAGPTDHKTLTTMTDSGETVYGCFTKPSISYRQRLKVVRAAKSLVGSNFGYPGFGANAVEPLQGEPNTWDGKLNTIGKMRCDALVEVCYEINGVEVWGMLRDPDGLVHYGITDQSDKYDYDAVRGVWQVGPNGESDNLEEHNDFDTLWGDWMDTLMPATQCGYVTPIDSATRFQRQDLCVPAGSKGGNP